MVEKNNKAGKTFTTVLNKKDIHSIVKKYNNKEAYEEYRKLWIQSYELNTVPDYPIQLDFEINYSCNFRCPMCTWSAESTKGMGKETWFDFEVFKEVIDDGVKKGLKVIRLNYINEPLIRPELVKFIKYARQAGILDIYFSTNGSLLSEKVSHELITSGLTRVQVSLDAHSEEMYKKIRISNFTLKGITDNIINFMKIRDLTYNSELPTLRVNFVKTEENQHELDDFVAFWRDKVDGVGVQDLVNIMSPSDNKEMSNIIDFKCAQPFNHLVVRYNGSILPCCTFFGAELPVARLKSKDNPHIQFSKKKNIAYKEDSELLIQTIQETWKSPKMNFLREIHRKGEYWKHPVCKRCVESTSHHDETQG